MTIAYVLRNAWRFYTEAPLRHALVLFVYAAASVVGSAAIGGLFRLIFGEESLIGASCIAVGDLIFAAWLLLGVYLCALRSARGESAGVGTLFAGAFALIGAVLVQLILGFLIVMTLLPAIGAYFALNASAGPAILVLAAIPAIVWLAVRLNFATLFVIEDRIDAFDAVRALPGQPCLVRPHASRQFYFARFKLCCAQSSRFSSARGWPSPAPRRRTPPKSASDWFRR